MEKVRPDTQIATLHALAEPTRKRIVELLRDGPKTVGEIGEKLGLKQPQASKHLKVLSEGGILEVKAEANRRYYGLRAEPFVSLETWLSSFRQAMEERYDNLDRYLDEIQKKKD